MNLRLIFLPLLFMAMIFQACTEAKIESEAEASGGVSFEKSSDKTTSTTITTSRGNSSSFSSSSSSSKVKVGGSAKVSKSVIVRTGIPPRIRLKKGNDYHSVDVYDFNDAGKLEYQTIELKKPTTDPVFYTFDYLCKGNLRRYVRNIKITSISSDGQERDLHFEGMPVFEDKAAEKDFLLILHKTAQAYTEYYRFYMNGKEFR